MLDGLAVLRDDVGQLGILRPLEVLQQFGGLDADTLEKTLPLLDRYAELISKVA